MSNLLITGGQLRDNGFELGEGKYYGCAKLLRLDTNTGNVKEVLSDSVGSNNFPDSYPNLEFTVGDIEKDSLWLSMDTELRCYSYPGLQLLKTFSHPCFHNIHSVAVHRDKLYVTSTGIDTVVVLDKENGSIIEYINTEGKPIWHRFEEDFDYRKIHSTRPHDSHPNFIFWIDEEPWVTRCTQEDAVQLSNVNNRIDISGPDKEISVHDGIVYGGYVYFTSVDGFIVIADIKTKKVVESFDVTKLKGYGGLRGWCRGLYINKNIFYIAFSRLRKTRRIEKIKWVSHLINKGKSIEHCSILAIDMDKRVIVADYHISDQMIDAIYTILPEPR
ncbi:MAG: hypothetical protein OEW87_01795 [Flavobacteriaceae bacterium]|nr:hypothetical protein [Flavobacteriaceae bacterium]